MKCLFFVSITVLLSLNTLFSGSCSSTIPAISESLCHGSANDGSIIIKAWGYGKSNNEAMENAKKNAVQDVLFKGIKSIGQSGCPSRAIVEDISKRESEYFKKFFQKEGMYLQFVNLSTDNVPDRVKAGRYVKAGIYVVVDHRRLKKQMEQDNQARGLNTGF